MTRPDPAASLVRRMAGGDADALERLYDEHATLLYSVALRIAGAEADAEQVAQEAWIEAWDKARAFDPSRATVAVWLLSIVRRRALDLLRASRRRPEARVPPVELTAAEPAAGAEDLQVHQRVKLAMQRLDPHQRLVLESAYFEGLSQSDIAERLEAPPGTVKSWTRRALLRLKELLPQEGGA